jgi:hypothetical protein
MDQKSSLRHARFTVMAVCSILYGMRLMAQVSLVNPAEAARQVLLAAYPDLAGKSALVEITAGPYSLDVQWPRVSRLVLAVRENPVVPTTTKKMLFDSELVFDDDQHFTELRSVGPLVNSERYTALVALVEHHGEWSEAQIAAALRGRGAQFAPNQMKDAAKVFEPRLRLLEAIIGRFEFESVRFEARIPEQVEASLQTVLLNWHVRLKVYDDGSGPTEYDVYCEPFDGQILRILSFRSSGAASLREQQGPMSVQVNSMRERAEEFHNQPALTRIELVAVRGH